MPTVERCWHKVRRELAEVGLLYDPEGPEDGGYLGQIELCISSLASWDESGSVDV